MNRTELEYRMATALRNVEKYLVDRGIEYRGTVGRTQILPEIRAALFAFDNDTREEED